MKTSGSVNLPSHRAPAVGLESPFEMLVACHERVNRSLELLHRLQAHLADMGLDEAARQAARDVMRYFDVAAPAHHQDEELHVFPPLLQASDPELHEIVNKLMNDHRAMETRWSAARTTLTRITECSTQAWTPLTPEQTDSLNRFSILYGQHIADEERIVYPAARSSMTTSAIRVMSEDMKRRRGVN
jgi:hemerythrin-like domain-containing protein